MSAPDLDGLKTVLADAISSALLFGKFTNRLDVGKYVFGEATADHILDADKLATAVIEFFAGREANLQGRLSDCYRARKNAIPLSSLYEPREVAIWEPVLTDRPEGPEGPE